MEYDVESIETKWRERWQSEGWYEATPDGDSDTATFVTVPYPYPNGAMHVGHIRTYTVPDVYARYRRMCGDNVLFPMAWHVTGTPIIGAVERLKSDEPEQLRILTDVFNVPESDLSALETPMEFAEYFIENSYKQAMRRLGLSIDWRREFTTNDEAYREFISWQYETLHDRGLLTNDTHPVNYCTNEEQPVTTHDLLEGEDAEFQEYTLIKFSLGETVVPMATLRPETVMGVTNAFVDPEAAYVRATVDSEEWIVAKDAIKKLELQERSITILEEFTGSELVGKSVDNPVTDTSFPILPATFVDPDNATGVVMSVPAHSPDDWVALAEVKADPASLAPYGIEAATVESIEPVSIIDIDGYGPYPAKDAVESHNITGQDDPALEDATKELYNREFHDGRLKDMYGEYAGEVVEDVRDELRESFYRAGTFDRMYEFNEEVVCRCGGSVEVAVQDTWFLRYNDPDWQAKTRRALEGMHIHPTSARDQYDHTIGWLEEWPCIRNYGLGTPLPWDDDFIIEPLSDSTIYMAYYTLAHHLEDLNVTPDRSFFGDVFTTEAEGEALERVREEFDYWYPVDVRFSASELIPNHLTFYIYHHAELFDETHWPQGITTMGMGLLRGQSMSSSAGRVVLANETVDRYGADTTRFFLLNSAEPWQEFDWRPEPVKDTANQLERFWRRALEIIDAPAGERDLEPIDKWLLSRLQRTIRGVTESIETYETRSASQLAFYDLEEDLRWYRRRTDVDRPGARWVLREVLTTRLRLLSPFIPYMTNELHERLHGEPAEHCAWPSPAADLEDDRLETAEDYLSVLLDDIDSIVDITDSDPAVVHLYVAEEWKRDVLATILELDEPTIGSVMGELMSEERFRQRGNAVKEVVSDLIDLVHERPRDQLTMLTNMDERAIIRRSSSFLAEEFGAEIEVYRADDNPVDPANKASSALPARPAIYLE